MSAWLELASTERITAAGGVVVSLYVARTATKVKTLETKVADLQAERERDQSVIKAALNHIRELITHNAILASLLGLHAPGVVIPDKPPMPEELKEV